MPSERMQRQIDRLLDEAEKAASEKDWPQVADCARDVLAVDADNEDAVAFLAMAERQGNLPPRETQKHPSSSSDDKEPSLSLPATFAGGRYVVIGSMGGAPTDPQWVHNLRAQPQVRLQDGATTHELTARELSGDERKILPLQQAAS